MARSDRPPPAPPDAPPWYKEAVVYEVRLGTFQDSDGDGIGDLGGLVSRLDYLQDLGVTALWLLPFYPSPLRDDGYDIADYTAIRPDAGTLADFRRMLREAHRRGLRVITELVLNHTSDQHPWFQEARRAKPGSRARDFYVWSDDPKRYKAARIIFKDFETSNWTWDSAAKAYFWHRFFNHQPDLNFDNPAVRAAMFKVVDFWFELGVDGLRLDAVPYLFEREGTSCENLPETHAFLKELRRHVDANFPDRMLLAEANQWPEHAVDYFGRGDECHMAFHFPIMPRLFMSIHMEDRFPLVDIMRQTPPIPEGSQWALFLRNHDELTLEMVTDEERDYMYRYYAAESKARLNLGIRRRLAPLLGNNRRKIELMNGLLFSLPGTPVLYYGDEIGMGDNFYLGDRNGVRTPMQWSADKNAGFSRANPQKLLLPIIIDPEYHYEAVNVEAQLDNPSSLLWWMKRLIALRKRWRAFGMGAIEFLAPRNSRVLAFVRSWKEERLLVVANLSRFPQYVELDLSAYKGSVPVEVFGRNEFPAVGDLPYLLTLGPHAFYWFALEPARTAAPPAETLPHFEVRGAWTELLHGRSRGALEHALPRLLASRPWFDGRSRRLKSCAIAEAVPVPLDGTEALLLLVHAEFAEGLPATYLLPVAFATGPRVEALAREASGIVLCRVRTPEGEGVLYDAAGEPAFAKSMVEAAARRRRFKGASGTLEALGTGELKELQARSTEGFQPGPEKSGATTVLGGRILLKFYRRLEPGENPDLELRRFLTEQGYANIPRTAGALTYRAKSGATLIGMLQEFIPAEGDAWEYTLSALDRFYEQARTLGPAPSDGGERRSYIRLAAQTPPAAALDAVGGYSEQARLLGQRIAELHLALASRADQPEFAPEPFTPFYQRSLYQSLRNSAALTFRHLRDRLPGLPEAVKPQAHAAVALEPRLLKAYRAVMDMRLSGLRTRHHGDLHLGRVLFTGRDFILTGFDGDPARPLGERRIKRSPLRDVAALLRSFHYAASVALERETPGLSADLAAALGAWGRVWVRTVGAVFVRSYLEKAAAGGFLPESEAEREGLLGAFLLERAVYELGHELETGPERLPIPIDGLTEALAGFPE